MSLSSKFFSARIFRLDADNNYASWMGLDPEQATPSIASNDDEGESSVSSTLFFEKSDALLVVDDVRQF